MLDRLFIFSLASFEIFLRGFSPTTETQIHPDFLSFHSRQLSTEHSLLYITDSSSSLSFIHEHMFIHQALKSPWSPQRLLSGATAFLRKPSRQKMEMNKLKQMWSVLQYFWAKFQYFDQLFAARRELRKLNVFQHDAVITLTLSFS